VGGAKLLASVGALAFAAQPLAVQEVAAGEVDGDAGPGEPLDGLAVEWAGCVAVAQQCP